MNKCFLLCTKIEINEKYAITFLYLLYCYLTVAEGQRPELEGRRRETANMRIGTDGMRLVWQEFQNSICLNWYTCSFMCPTPIWMLC